MILDLGCGTGLELEELFAVNPGAKVTGIDLSEAMLNALKAKFPEKDLTLVCASYFDVPFGENAYDAAVSVVEQDLEEGDAVLVEADARGDFGDEQDHCRKRYDHDGHHEDSKYQSVPAMGH